MGIDIENNDLVYKTDGNKSFGYGNNYKVRLDFIGDIQEDGYTVYTAARDIDEIKAWRLEMKAQIITTKVRREQAFIRLVTVSKMN